MRWGSLLPTKLHRRNFWLVRGFLRRLRLDRWRTERTSSLPDTWIDCPCESSQEEADLFPIETALATADLCPSEARRNIFVCLLRRRKRHTRCASLLPPVLSPDTSSIPSRRRRHRTNCRDFEKAALALSVFRKADGCATP